MMQRAYLQRLDNKGEEKGDPIEVQFNPASLRTSYSLSGQISRAQRPGRGGGLGNRGETQDNNTTNTNQETGFRGALDVELLFDTTETGTNVQAKTRPILALLAAEAADPTVDPDNGTTVPYVRFQCGTFYFVGRLNSFNETLDYFSDEGKPMRSTVSINLTMADPKRIADAPNGGGGASAAAGFSAALSASASAQLSASGSLSGSAGVSGGASFGGSLGGSASFSSNVGSVPLTIAQGGESIQSIAASTGVDWRAAASLNGIDNPRKIQAGAVLNLRSR